MNNGVKAASRKVVLIDLASLMNICYSCIYVETNNTKRELETIVHLPIKITCCSFNIKIVKDSDVKTREY